MFYLNGVRVNIWGGRHGGSWSQDSRQPCCQPRGHRCWLALLKGKILVQKGLHVCGLAWAPPPMPLPQGSCPWLNLSPFLSKQEKPALGSSEHLQSTLLFPQGSAHGGSPDLVSLQSTAGAQEPRKQG